MACGKPPNHQNKINHMKLPILKKVSIGIPAYNEEANIKNLLTALLAQKQENFELLEIIVISDGSDDNTVEQAKSLASEKISVIDGKDRKGQAQRQNEIME